MGFINRRLWQLDFPDVVAAVAEIQFFGIWSVILASPFEAIDWGQERRRGFFSSLLTFEEPFQTLADGIFRGASLALL